MTTRRRKVPEYEPIPANLTATEKEEEEEEEEEGFWQDIPEGSWKVCLVLTLVALWTRLYKIGLNPHVTWVNNLLFEKQK